MPHQGEILQDAIKSSGISITRIVEELGITRPTIYRKFKEEKLDTNFVKSVGQIIGHDFSNDFTLMQQSVASIVTSVTKPVVSSHSVPRTIHNPVPDADSARQLLALQAKYITLLEAYNDLLLKVYGPK